MKKKCQFSDLMIGISCVGLGVAVVIMANGLQKVKLGIGPGGFPRFIGFVLILLGAIQLIKVVKNGLEKPAVHIERKQLLLFLASVAACFAYVMVVQWLGFLISTILLLYGMMLLYGNKRYVLCAVITVVFTVAVWLLFTKVFLIFLPAGKLF